MALRSWVEGGKGQAALEDSLNGVVEDDENVEVFKEEGSGLMLPEAEVVGWVTWKGGRQERKEGVFIFEK